MTDNKIPDEGHIPVTGGNVWYKIANKYAKGIPLVVVHGGPGLPHNYLLPLENLCDERPVIFYDQTGCGNSISSDDILKRDVEYFVDELHQVCTALRLEKFYILGNSWGAMLAVKYTLRFNRGAVAGLILPAPVLSVPMFIADVDSCLNTLPENIIKTIRQCEDSGDFVSPEYQEAIMTFYKRHFCRTEPWPDYLFESLGKMGHGVFAHMFGKSVFSLTGVIRDCDLTESLKNITVPTLLTSGRHDYTTPAATQYFCDKIPGARMIVFENASHLHHIEQSEEFLRAVREFLKSIE